MRRKLRDFGFPVLVLAALIASGYLAASAPMPDPVPDFALQAAAVYRLEVGAASFAALYLAVMALVLALDGRGFAELGTKGLRAVEVIRAADDQKATISRQLRFDQDTRKSLAETKAAIEDAVDALRAQEERLEKLEEER